MRSTLAGFPGKEELECSGLFCLVIFFTNLTVNTYNTRQVVGLPLEENFLLEATKSLEKCIQFVLGHLGVYIVLLMRRNDYKLRCFIGNMNSRQENIGLS